MVGESGVQCKGVISMSNERHSTGLQLALAVMLLLVVVAPSQAESSDSASTTITFPGGFTLSTTSAIVGALAIVALIIVGVAYILRGKSGGNVNNVIVQNAAHAKLQDI